METPLLLLATSLVAGFIGAMMGVGGGIVVVPVLVGLLHVPVRLAIGASMVGVVATSSAAAAVFVRDRLSNLRLGILASLFSVVGALAGVLVGKVSGGRVVTGVFAGVLVVAALAMLRRHRDRAVPPGSGGFLERSLSLTGRYEDRATGETVRYGVRHVHLGLLSMLGAGLVSGLLGIGGGIFQVPVMDAVMGMPIKAATATSNFMMGITAAAGATAYFAMGEVHPLVAGPVTIGVFFGSLLGARVMPRVRDARLRHAFIVLLMVLAATMAWRAVRGDGVGGRAI